LQNIAQDRQQTLKSRTTDELLTLARNVGQSKPGKRDAVVGIARNAEADRVTNEQSHRDDTTA
jgi:hypothetical protein